jgi:hypothetical protein
VKKIGRLSPSMLEAGKRRLRAVVNSLPVRILLDKIAEMQL